MSKNAVSQEISEMIGGRWRNCEPAKSDLCGLQSYQLRPDGSLVLSDANASADEVLGLDHRALVGKTFEEIWPMLAGAQIPDKLRRTASEGISYRWEHGLGGGTNAYEITAFQTGAERLSILFRPSIDHLETARTSESRLRKIFEESLVGIVTMDPHYRIESVNPAYCQITGYSAEELTSMTFYDVTHPEDVDEGLSHLHQMAAGLIPYYRIEKRYLRKNGEITWASITESAIRDENGDIQYFLATIEDISARKNAEQALADEKEELYVTLRSIGDGVITTDTDGRVVLLNRVAEDLTGWSQRVAEGKLLTEVFPIINEHTRETCENPVEKVLKTGGIIGLANHTALIARDGRERIIADSGAPIRNHDGRIIGVVLVFRDITEQQKMETRLVNAERLQSLGVLAGGIAHDFNNLLTGVFGFMILARDHAQEGKADRALANLDRGLAVFDRARALTQQLLTFSKGGQPHKKRLNLADIIRDAAHFVLSGSNVGCEFSLAPDLWACEADEQQIAQVIDNIVLNAQQAMPTGGVIRLKAENLAFGAPRPPMLDAQAYIRVTITDQGIGIAHDHRSRIFDPFFTTKQQGSGLGLATAYSIVRHHDGLIDVESEIGKGSIFHIYLPAIPEKTMDIPETEPQASGFRSHGRVLVMDDEDFLRDCLSELLTSTGFEVETVPDGHTAVDRYHQALNGERPFRLVILDLTVPGGMGGKETLQHLKELDPSVSAIAISGYSGDPIMANPHAFGFKRSIAKPFQKKEFVETLESVLVAGNEPSRENEATGCNS